METVLDNGPPVAPVDLQKLHFYFPENQLKCCFLTKHDQQSLGKIQLFIQNGDY